MPLAVTGCEDGPNQTYSPAPPNAGGIWNGSPGSGGLGDGGAFVATSTQGFDASSGGTNANDLCTAAQEKQVWGQLFQQPVLPPGIAAGIDIAGGSAGDGNAHFVPGMPYSFDPTKETWTGCTVEQAEKILCQATSTSDQIFYGVTNTVGWGEQLEVNAEFNTNSRAIEQWILGFGYAGPLSGTDKNGNTYSITLNNQLGTLTNKQGQTTQILLDWANPTSLDTIANAMYEAFRYTYIPTFPPDANAVNAGHVIIGNNGTGGGYFWFTPMNLAIFVNTTVGTQVANSTWGLIDLGLLKLLPFSNSNNLMKLDKEGPTSVTPDVQGLATTDPNYSKTTTCKYVLGMDFKDFNSQCVQVFNATTNPTNYAAQNTIAENKLFGAMSHSDEAYNFDIVGVDPQFAGVVGGSLTANTVLADGQKPADSDVAFQLELDQNILGIISNDWQYNNPITGVQDLHGLGLITLEWANLVQHYMQKAYGVTTELGDPRCLNGNPFKGAGYVCSGIEGIVTTAPPSSVTLAQMKANALGLLAPQQIAPAAYLAQGLKPGTWYSVFCNDAGGVSGGVVQGYNNCWGASAPFQGAATYYFDAMQDGVLQTGNWGAVLSELPTRDLGSRRFFFQQWILACVKYFQADTTVSTDTAGTGYVAPTLAQIDAEPVDPNELFFDSNGGGFESGEYVFRNIPGQAPTDLQITTNLTTAVINDWSFGRYNFRGENTMYTALTTTPGDFPGTENLYLSNIVGSPLLQSTYGSYSCAINLDPNNAACTPTGAPAATLGPAAPVGTACPASVQFPAGSGTCPQFYGYEPAFGASVFNIAAYGAQATAAAFTVDTAGPATGPYPLIESAMITVPIWSNPFDPTSAKPATDKTISALLPFLPKGAGVGFPVTIDGSRDKFYNTNQMTFTGETLDATLDFESVAFNTADGGVTTGNVVRAVESTNYLGLAFACVQTSIGPDAAHPLRVAAGQPDVLAVRMYENADDLLEYLKIYPSATAACGIQIKYSPYGNYADYISSLQYGVRFGLTPGFGGAVVTDLTLFDPNVVATLGQ
jgi:hypothetical protein